MAKKQRIQCTHFRRMDEAGRESTVDVSVSGRKEHRQREAWQGMHGQLMRWVAAGTT